MAVRHAFAVHSVLGTWGTLLKGWEGRETVVPEPKNVMISVVTVTGKGPQQRDIYLHLP